MQPQNTEHNVTTKDDAAIVIQFHGVTKRFTSRGREVTALESVDLEVKPGLVTGLIGPDAAGKTTIMRLITALLVPDNGRVDVLGMDTQDHAIAIQSLLSYMPQHFGLYEDLTVQENLDLYANLHGLSGSHRNRRSQKLLHVADLERFTARRAGHLSGGMKQKLGLACALVGEPQLLLLDEPTAGVDPLSRRQLWRIIDQLVEDEGLTVLVSTAYLDEAQRCEELIILFEGRVLGTGPPRDFLEPLDGRVSLIRVPEHSRRTVQQHAAKQTSILAATIEARGVRVLGKTDDPPSLEPWPPELGPVQVQSVSPRIEDAFIEVVHAQRQDRKHAGHAEATFVDPTNRQQKDLDDIIAVDEVSRRFGTFYAVRNISFAVRPGEIFGLLGANGAGKSTTFRMLCGLLPATSGRLLVSGLDLRHAAAAARAQIGYMAQKFSLYEKLTIRENLTFFSRAYGLRSREQRQRVTDALEQFGLESYADVASVELPLGYKQRLSMACALMHEPKIVFLDEPTSGVDPLARREFWDRIVRLADAGVTIMVTTHFMNEAEYCDRIAIMNAGEILALDTPERIRRRVRTEDRSDPTMEEAFIQLIEEARAVHETHR